MRQGVAEFGCISAVRGRDDPALREEREMRASFRQERQPPRSEGKDCPSRFREKVQGSGFPGLIELLQRLVEDPESGPDREETCQEKPLLLPARERGRVSAIECGETHSSKAFLDPFDDLRPGHPEGFESKCQLGVTAGREDLLVGVLGDEPDFFHELERRGFSHVKAVEKDRPLQRPPRKTRHQTRDYARERGLARICRPEKHGHPACPDGQRESVMHEGGFFHAHAGVAERQVFHGEQW